MSTVSWSALLALRMRVSMSAIGSVCRLPARFRHAGDRALVRELAQADAAEAELAGHVARGRPQRLQRRCTRALVASRLARISRSSDFLATTGSSGASSGEREPERRRSAARSSSRLRVVDRDVEAADGWIVVVVDLREDDLLADPEREVAAAVERVRVEAAEVADAGQAIEISRSRNSHMRSPRSVTLRADGHALADLEPGDRRAGAAQRGRAARRSIDSSSIAASRTFESVFASPTPMLSVIFWMRGTSMTVDFDSSSLSAPRSSSLYRVFRRGTYSVAVAATSGRPPGGSRRGGRLA
jgi:hypothetical protein